MVNINLIESIKKHHAFHCYISSTTKIQQGLRCNKHAIFYIYKIQKLTGMRKLNYVWYHTTCRKYLQKRSNKRLKNYNEQLGIKQ